MYCITIQRHPYGENTRICRNTDAPPTGRIRLALPPVPGGTVPRADVAAVIAALLDNPGTGHQTLELRGGDSPVAVAVHSIS